MRLKRIDITNAPPVKRFLVDDLSDLVVLAGPNGVGKTRLIQSLLTAMQGQKPDPVCRLVIEATNDDERKAWSQDSIDTSNADEFSRLRTTLQRNRRRKDWRSSVYQIESDRALGNINPYSFTFDAVDPFEELVPWNLGIGRLRDRFQDTQQSIFRKIHARRTQIAAQAEAAMLRGETTLALDFPDPLAPFKSAFSRLLAPKRLLDADPRDQQLYYMLDGNRLPISTLSSGEREVVNVVFDFIMRNPTDSIVIFDEPELHLHPELNYRLVQTLRAVGERNQFILITHSADIITASLDSSVVFVAPPRDDGSNQAIPVREDDKTNQALRLLGQSVGIVSLGKRLVLIEGTASSLDKQTYGAILSDRFPGFVLVPSGSKGLIRSFSTLVSAVLSQTIWGVDFFMLCDRDAIPPHADESAMETSAGGKLRILKRYHLENYFLDEHVLASAFEPLEKPDSWLRDPGRIRLKLEEIARETVPYATALIVAARRREQLGNLDLMVSNCHNASVDQLSALFVARARSERARFAGVVDETDLEAEVRRVHKELEESFQGPEASWRTAIPGKVVFYRFCSLANLDSGRVKQLYIRAAEAHSNEPFADIVHIFEDFGKVTN